MNAARIGAISISRNMHRMRHAYKCSMGSHIGLSRCTSTQTLLSRLFAFRLKDQSVRHTHAYPYCVRPMYCGWLESERATDLPHFAAHTWTRSPHSRGFHGRLSHARSLSLNEWTQHKELWLCRRRLRCAIVFLILATAWFSYAVYRVCKIVRLHINTQWHASDIAI